MPKTCTTCGTPLENGYWCPKCDARALDTILASICNTAECQKKNAIPRKRMAGDPHHHPRPHHHREVIPAGAKHRE